jgi:diketogulonate reductase-like aldo/keto reductase
MYADGRAEELVGEAIAGRRDEVFLVSKAYRHMPLGGARLTRVKPAWAALRSDALDLYLLHWRGSIPLEII